VSILAGLPLIGQVIKSATKVIDDLVVDKDLKAQLQAQIQLQALNLDASAFQAEIEARAKVLVAEIGGESWLQRNWRPLLMLSFVAIVVNNYIVVPLFGSPPAEVPSDMWDLLKIGVGGYVVGRSVEKGLKTWKAPSA
jgi:hypothetical protein